MNSNKMFIIGVIIAAIAAFAIISRSNKSAETGGSPAPSFNFDPSLLIRDHSYSKGPADASVTIVEFLDPECEACAAMHPIVKSLLQEYEGKVRLVVRYMLFHPNSLYAAALLEEARESGKYDQVMDVFAARLPEWGDHHNPKPELLSGYMVEQGIDKMRTERDYVIPKFEAKIRMDEADGEKLGVNRTPTFFVNGVMLHEIGYTPIKAAIEAQLK